MSPPGNTANTPVASGSTDKLDNKPETQKRQNAGISTNQGIKIMGINVNIFAWG